MAITEVTKEEELNIESVSWGDLVWITVEKPTGRETKWLAERYPFHPLDLDDCLSRIQRPKIDEYKDYLFIVLHFSIFNKITRVSTHTQVSVFIGEKYLITLHGGELKTMAKLFRECQLDEETRKEYLSQGSGYLLYRILDRLVDSYFPILDKILRWTEEVEDSVFDENIEAAMELSILRRDIITQRRIIFPMRTVMGSLEKKLQRFSKMDLTVYFGDLMDHMNKICETLDECKEIIEVYKDTDSSLASARLNRLSRVLAIVSSIILPFLVISSLYGMNIALPGGLEKGSLHSFIVLASIMVAIAAGMLLFFHRRRWI